MEESNKKNKEIKPEDKRVLLISIFMIFALTAISSWRFFNYESPEISLSIPMKEETHIPSIDEITSLEYLDKMIGENGEIFPQEEERKYVRETLENKIYFDHPSSWRIVDLNNIENAVEKIEVVFLSHSQTSLYGATFTVLKLEAEDSKEAIDIIKETSQDIQKTEMEVLEEEEKEGKFFLKIIHKSESGGESFSENRLFLMDKEYYFFSVITSKEGIDRFSSQINHILSSIQIKE